MHGQRIAARIMKILLKYNQEVWVKIRIRFLAITLVLLSILVPSCSAPDDQQRIASPDQKYLVVFVVDACRPDYLPFSDIPNIKKLASEGTSYTNA